MSILSSCYKGFDSDSYKPKFSINGLSSPDEVQPEKLIAYMAFEGDAKDAKGVTGTATGVTYENGYIGKGASLSADKKSFITLPSASLLSKISNGLTVTMWVKATFVDKHGKKDGDNQPDKKNDKLISVFNLSHPSYEWSSIDAYIEVGKEIDNASIYVFTRKVQTSEWGSEQGWFLGVDGLKTLYGNWVHHAFTYDAKEKVQKYYINGAEVKCADVKFDGPIDWSGVGPFVFGCEAIATNPPLTSSTAGLKDSAASLTGMIDEIRIFSDALSPTDINNLVVLQGKLNTKK